MILPNLKIFFIPLIQPIFEYAEDFFGRIGMNGNRKDREIPFPHFRVPCSGTEVSEEVLY